MSTKITLENENKPLFL